MGLSEYEKYQVYQEEMSKKKMEDEAEKERKLKILSQKEREDIYQQYKKKVVLVDFDNFKEPDEKKKRNTAG